jgi:hypothetical protein
VTGLRFSELPAGPIPSTPLFLGLAGLIPFWVLAGGLALKGVGPFSCECLDLALASYAAIILSFLGGIRWGLAVASADRPEAGMHFMLSVMPSLAAWILLVLPEPWRLTSLGCLSLALGPLDRGLVLSGFAAPWLGRLRLLLSSGAGMALLAGAVAWRV